MASNEKTKRFEDLEVESERFVTKSRLNLNDLLKRKSEEEKVDKKTNLIVLSCITALAVVILLILSL